MVCKGRRKSATVCSAAAIILMGCLVQTIDCYRLRKTEKREGKKETGVTKTAGVQEGKIVFGKVFEKGSGLESQVIDGKKSSSNASVENERGYQADFAGWPRGLTKDASAKEASWNRMVPSLQCSGDQLKFKAVGPGASQFAVEQGNAPSVPLSQVPPSCGYSMQRNSLALVMLVPFDGCHMVQEGGSYVLPLRWQGIPVSLWCPKPEAPAAPHQPVSQTPKHPPLHPRTFQVPHNSKGPDVPKMPYYFPSYPQHPSLPQYPSLPHPTTTTTTTTTTKKPIMPQMPSYPFFQFPYIPPPLPVTTAAPTTTTATTTMPAATAPHQMFPFFMYPPNLPFPWFFQTPATTAKPTTTTPTTTTKAPLPQFPQFPPPFPFFFPYFFPPHYAFPTPEMTTTTPTPTTTTTAPPTTPTTTTVTPSPVDHVHPHTHYPVLPYPFGYPFPPVLF